MHKRRKGPTRARKTKWEEIIVSQGLVCQISELFYMYHSFKGWQVWPTKGKKNKNMAVLQGGGWAVFGSSGVFLCVWLWDHTSDLNWLSSDSILSPALPSCSGWSSGRVLSVASQSDRASWGMKSSKTGSWSGRRRPRVPAVLGYSSLLYSNSVEEKLQPRIQCDCCQTSGVLRQPVELIMFKDPRDQSAAIIPNSPLNVGDSANGTLTSCYRR